MEEGGQPSDQNSSFEADLDVEKSSDLDVEAEKEKAKSKWDEPEDVSHSKEPDDESKEEEAESSSRVGTPTLPSSPRSCPPTPEALPQGLRTPPPSTSSGQVRQGWSLVQALNNIPDTEGNESQDPLMAGLFHLRNPLAPSVWER